jgi:hypothetical protein
MTTLDAGRHIHRMIDQLTKEGWEQHAYDGGRMYLSPDSRLQERYGLAPDAHFYFDSLEEASAWARGWKDHAFTQRVGAPSKKVKK